MSVTVLDGVTLAAGVLGAGVAAPRWLRIAQREHYLAGSTARFAERWWSVGRANPALVVLGVAAVAVGAAVAPVAILAAVVAAAAPIGLGLRGRTSPLAWTPRLRALASVTAVLYAAGVAAAALGGWAGTGSLRVGAVVACALGLVLPLVVDAALVATRPLERRRLAPFLRQARTRLAQVHPTVVAITGSYGKTSTKGYVAHLVGGTRSVVPSPRSFNNRAGLATAINQGLSPGTDVFVAEMGTYGPGEIAELCELVPPDVAVICAIGPVHLERMGSEERIAEAKAEILERAPVAVLNVDHPLLAALADRAEAAGKKVWRCSASPPSAGRVDDADNPWVVVEEDGGKLRAHLLPGEIAEVTGVHAAATNVACAVAVALELGVPAATIAARLPGLPTAEHRLTVTEGGNGQTIVDDTYNANPAGGRAALHLAAQLGSGSGRRIVVTPGMVELGARQVAENQAFAAAAAAVASHVVIVGATNSRALVAGAGGHGAEIVEVRDRPAAVAWVTANTGTGDVILYENDLPDHFP